MRDKIAAWCFFGCFACCGVGLYILWNRAPVTITKTVVEYRPGVTQYVSTATVAKSGDAPARPVLHDIERKPLVERVVDYTGVKKVEAVDLGFTDWGDPKLVRCHIAGITYRLGSASPWGWISRIDGLAKYVLALPYDGSDFVMLVRSDQDDIPRKSSEKREERKKEGN